MALRDVLPDADAVDRRICGANNRRICYKPTMPDSPFDGNRATQKPLPHCKAFLICRKVGVDDATGEFSLSKIINTLEFPTFPAEAGPFAIFLQLYDGIGSYDLSVELRDLADDISVAVASLTKLDFPEQLVKMELALPITSLRLPHAGRYEIAVLFDGREVAPQFIDAEVPDGSETG